MSDSGGVRVRLTLLMSLLCALLFQPVLANTLIEMSKSGDFDQLAVLLNDGVEDIDAAQGDGTTALAWSVYHESSDAVELLLHAGADPNLANDLGVTPLSLACDNGNAPILNLLLEAGADPNIAKVTGVTPLMSCANRGAAEAVAALIQYGADVNAIENREDQTALMWAAAESHPEVVDLLVQAGADVNAVTRKIPEPEPYIIEDENVIFGMNYPPTIRFPEFSGGFTALYFTAQQGDIDSARILLNAGADVNAPNEEYGSAMIIALKSGHENMARFLLDNGANPDARDAWGISALHYALHKGVLIINTFRPANTHYFGWERHNMPGMVRALLEKGANPDPRISYSLPYHNDPFFARAMEDPPQVDPVGATPLLIAAISGDIESMKILLEYGADKDAKTIGGGSLFMLAAGLGSERGSRTESDAIAAAKFVLSLGDIDVSAHLTERIRIGPGRDKPDGRTALHHAVYLQWSDMIRFLVESGADIEARDRYGMTPMLMAMGDPEGRLHRQVGAGNSDARFRTPPPIENKRLSSLLLELGAEPFTGTYRDRSGE